MALGKNTKFLRLAKGWSHDVLGEKVGTSGQTILQLEKRDSKKSVYGTAIAKVFGLPMELLNRLDLDDKEQAALLMDVLDRIRNGGDQDARALAIELMKLCMPQLKFEERESSEEDSIDAPRQLDVATEEIAYAMRQVFAQSPFGAPFGGSFSGLTVREPRAMVSEAAPPPYHTPIGTRRVPLLNYVQAGAVTEVVSDFLVDEYLLTDLDLSERAFALEIKGESMRAPPGGTEESFAPGDRIIIDCSVTPLPGDFVVAKNGNFNENGEQGATFKKYRPRGLDEQGREVFELTPLNRDFPTLYSDRQPLAIIGTMMEHRIYRKKR